MLTSKRQKQRAEELQQIKEGILTNLPSLNKRQIRRHRIPYHEALILELKEDEFEESANFLKALVDYQEAILKKAEEESIVWTKSLLKTDKTMIDIVYEGLKVAEIGIKENHKAVEIDKLLELAIYFSNQTDDWWWLAEQLFIQCINAAKDYHDDGAKKHAIVRYVFGKFQLQQMNDVERAKENLRIGRELANGQSWTAADVLKTHQGNLFKECCSLLYRGLLIMAKEKLKTDPAPALKLCNIAYKRALDAKDSAGEAECLFHQGLCELEMGMAQSALVKFNKVLIMHFSTNNKAGICETRIHLALAHSKLDNMSEAKYHLHQLLDYTYKHELKYYRALCHRYLGEIFLIRNIGHEASTHLLKALNMFHELNDYDNREQAKNLAAIASGMQLIRPLMKLINSCDKKIFRSMHNLIRLVKWKDSRAEFWEQGDESDNYIKKYMETCGEFARSLSNSNSRTYLPSVQDDDSALSSLHASRMTTISTVSQYTFSAFTN